jgi:hypothetical protein
LENVDSTEAREHQVEDDEVRPVFAGEGQRFIAVACLHDAIASADDDPDELPQIFVVLADEDRLGSAGLHAVLLLSVAGLSFGFASCWPELLLQRRSFAGCGPGTPPAIGRHHGDRAGIPVDKGQGPPAARGLAAGTALFLSARPADVARRGARTSLLPGGNRATLKSRLQES